MAVSAQKSFCFEIVPTRKSWYSRNPGLLIGQETVSGMDPEDCVAYLGSTLNLWRGMGRTQSAGDLRDALERLCALKLKPLQKLNLLKVYILPRYLHGFVAKPPSQNELRELDRHIRGVVKRMFHLPAQVSNGLLYSAPKRGGLGVPRLLHQVGLAVLRNVVKMRDSADPMTREAVRDEAAEARWQRVARSLRLEWPIENLAVLERAKRTLKWGEVLDWRNQLTQGQGVEVFSNDSIGNAWLTTGNGLSPSMHIEALKLRSNTAPTRVMLNAYCPQSDTSCRRCRGAPETLGHILGSCPNSKPAVIARHDAVCSAVLEELASTGSTFYVEQELRTEEGTMLKPDLLIVTETDAFVVDVTIRYERGESLKQGAQEKVGKYERLSGVVSRLCQRENVEVIPLVFGSRGAVPRSTLAALGRIGIKSRAWVLRIAQGILYSSVSIYSCHMDLGRR